MKTTVASLSAALLLSGVLVGCSGNDNAANNPNNNPANNGNGTRSIDYHNGNGMNNNPPGYANRNGYNNQNVNDNRDRNMDMNDNNGAVNDNNNNDVNYHSQKAQKLSDKVANLKNVEDAHVIVTDDDVVVGVKTNDQGTTKNYKSKIHKTVQNYVNDKDIHVTTDSNMYTRIQDTSNNIRNGTQNGMNEMGSDIRGIIDDLGNAAKRPFENNQ